MMMILEHSVVYAGWTNTNKSAGVEYDGWKTRSKSARVGGFGSRGLHSCRSAGPPPPSRPIYENIGKDRLHHLECLRDHRVTGRPVHRDSGSRDCLALAAEWVRTCIESHEQCGQQSKPVLPTRVVDVGSVYTFREPFLHISNGQQARYICLSHCWGSKRTLETTTSNLKALQKEISNSTLPPLYQDAVKVTRALGVQYLWIDSLCIIQDSADDWEFESTKMRSVYQNCLVTISALDARDSHERFLGIRPSTALVALPRKADQRTPETTFIRPRLRPLAEIRDQARLSTRAWTLQERALSPRILHYSSEETVWECQSHIEREGNCWPLVPAAMVKQQNEPWRSAYGEKFLMPRLAASIYALDIDKDRDLCFHTWYQLVTDYSGRALTKPSDRLPALRGLADEFARRTRCTYVAGLWKEDFIRGLLWVAAGSGNACEAKPWRAPSWSWVALDTPIRYLPIFRNLGAIDNWKQWASEFQPEVVDCRSAPAGRDPMGQLSSGEATIRGVLKLCRYSTTCSILPTWFHYPIGENDSSHQAREEELLNQGAFLLQDEAGSVIGRAWLDSLAHDAGVCTAFLTNITKSQYRIPENNASSCFGVDVCSVVLLQPSDHGNWKRVGVGRVIQDSEMMLSGPVRTKPFYFQPPEKQVVVLI